LLDELDHARVVYAQALATASVAQECPA